MKSAQYRIRRFWIPVIAAAALFVANSVVHATDSLQNIGVEVTTYLGDRQNFREGDVVSFLLTLERDAYITAIYIDADNNLFQLIPNSRQASHYYQADLFIPIPPKNADYNFRVQPPYGNETLWVFASDSESPELEGKNLDSGLVRLAGNIDAIRKTIKATAHKAFGEAKVSINTSAR
jgi:hypothetical protein